MNDSPIDIARPATRRTRQSRVVWGSRVVTVGGGAPVRVQSMTNTDTVDVIGTAIQVKELALAGSEMVRITVNTPEAAQAVPQAPQFARSVVRSRQLSEHSVRPTPHDVSHRPRLQTSPGTHALPHAPQLEGLLAVLTHLSSQHTSPLGQLLDSRAAAAKACSSAQRRPISRPSARRRSSWPVRR